MIIDATDPRLSYYAPRPVAVAGTTVRLERFAASTVELLRGQIGPLANCRSSAGCSLWFATDSPWIEVRLDRLRHHQPTPCHCALEISRNDQRWEVLSEDLRDRDGALTVRLPTGLERGTASAVVSFWLPPISTCAVAGVELADGAMLALHRPPPARWLAIGDSLTQGFVVSSPLQTWVHRLARRWQAPVDNLGIGGIRIEPAVFTPALSGQPYDLVTIALGSNHAWSDTEMASCGARAAELAATAAAGTHRRIVWLMPPWKPFEEGKGPPDFAGVPLDHAAAMRMTKVRAALRGALAPFAPRIQVVEDLMPHDARLLPDGLHPQAYGAARYADAVAAVVEPPVPVEDGDDSP